MKSQIWLILLKNFKNNKGINKFDEQGIGVDRSWIYLMECILRKQVSRLKLLREL